MDRILLAVTTEIKEEVTKDDIDLVKLKNLVEFALYVKNMAIDSVTGISSDPGFGVIGSMRAVPAYGPPPMERLLGDLLPQVLPLLEAKTHQDALSNLVALASSYHNLRKEDPKLATKIRARLETALAENEEKKEGTDETIHSQLSRRHTAV